MAPESSPDSSLLPDVRRFKKHRGKTLHGKIPHVPNNHKHNVNLDLYHEYPAVTYWSRDLKHLLGDRCFVCGWQEATNDCHHIIPLAKRGLNALINGIVLCPNHHRMAHKGKLDLNKLASGVRMALLEAIGVSAD